MADIVERKRGLVYWLRDVAADYDERKELPGTAGLLREAADEIERLRAPWSEAEIEAAAKAIPASDEWRLSRFPPWDRMAAADREFWRVAARAALAAIRR